MAAGFVDFAIPWRADVFGGAPQQSSAADFGTLGINFRARKPRTEAEWAKELETLICEMESMDQPTSQLGADAFYDAGDTGCAYGPLDEIALMICKLSPGDALLGIYPQQSVTIEGVWVGTTGYADDLQAEGFAPLREQDGVYPWGGSGWSVCQSCKKAAGLRMVTPA
ncbi:MAG: hypothetical protein IT329_07975 [Caldilineaceae bacterium]|nr:hypothetical protein [Caldilineaceae bacterium]